MDHSLTGSLFGHLVVAAIAGAVTLACIGAALKMLVRPGEKDPRHPKYLVLRNDR